MSEISAGFKTRLEYILDQICVETRNGGSHEMRRLVAEKLMAAAGAGERSIDSLTEVARQAMTEFYTQTVTESP
jgi:dihydroxyacetone kinase